MVTGHIVDQSLATFLDSSDLDIRCDLGYWPVIEAADSEVAVHIMGDISYHTSPPSVAEIDAAPLLVSFSQGYGLVLYSTFREEANLNDEVERVLVYMLYL